MLKHTKENLHMLLIEVLYSVYRIHHDISE